MSGFQVGGCQYFCKVRQQQNKLPIKTIASLSTEHRYVPNRTPTDPRFPAQHQTLHKQLHTNTPVAIFFDWIIGFCQSYKLNNRTIHRLFTCPIALRLTPVLPVQHRTNHNHPSIKPDAIFFNWIFSKKYPIFVKSDNRTIGTSKSIYTPGHSPSLFIVFCIDLTN